MSVTDREQLSDREKLERQTDLVNMMVHDLKGPLMEVMANLDLVINTPGIDDMVRECSATAMTGCENMTEIISDILQIGKLEAGLLKPEMGRLDMSSLAEEGLKKMRHTMEDKNLIPVFKSSGPTFVRADKKLIIRVLANLLINAIKFSPNGARLQVIVDKRGGRARCTVKDEGPGVPAEYRDAIFDKYVQVELRTHRVPGGAGLGLTFCKLAMEAQNGRIGLENTEHGSEFFFEAALDG
ncbi:MAG: HAMP domain-containing histidine kinase [Nitrospinae bacterium]|nr:HAMP domain-containing histidine kinase [Nitrospinota bacterium]